MEAREASIVNTLCEKCGKLLFPNASDWQVSGGHACRGDCQKVKKRGLLPQREAVDAPAIIYANAQKTVRRGANKTETLYGEKLHVDLLAGKIRSYEFEAITLKLGPDVRYTPDYLVITDGIELHEVKGGYAREDAMVKLRAASGRFPYFKFILAKYENGIWDVKEI